MPPWPPADPGALISDLRLPISAFTGCPQMETAVPVFKARRKTPHTMAGFRRSGAALKTLFPPQHRRPSGSPRAGDFLWGKEAVGTTNRTNQTNEEERLFLHFIRMVGCSFVVPPAFPTDHSALTPFSGMRPTSESSHRGLPLLGGEINCNWQRSNSRRPFELSRVPSQCLHACFSCDRP